MTVDESLGAPEREVTLVMSDNGVIAVSDGRQTAVSLFDPLAVDLDGGDQGAGSAVKAPMHGKLVALFVKAGDKVEKGQKLAIVEAMKMEHVLTAPRDGVITEVSGEPGAQVAQGSRIVSIADAG
jgi:3-methylcrotonyl-CoA carboxylase alpha subunit